MRNNQKLIADLQNKADKSAYYYCVLVLVRSEHDPQPVIADGIWNGEIVASARGEMVSDMIRISGFLR
jgi:XTP/dITP diphosphohydrolase